MSLEYLVERQLQDLDFIIRGQTSTLDKELPSYRTVATKKNMQGREKHSSTCRAKESYHERQELDKYAPHHSPSFSKLDELKGSGLPTNQDNLVAVVVPFRLAYR